MNLCKSSRLLSALNKFLTIVKNVMFILSILFFSDKYRIIIFLLYIFLPNRTLNIIENMLYIIIHIIAYIIIHTRMYP